MKERGVGAASLVRISVVWRLRVKAEVSKVPSVAVRKGSHPTRPTPSSKSLTHALRSYNPTLTELGFLVELTLLVS